MRLLRFYLGKYRVLRDLDIDFGVPSFTPHNEDPLVPSYSLDFLVGINGTGKSTVLRALAELFQALERNDPAAFPSSFKLEYEIGSGNDRRYVVIANGSDELPDEYSDDEAQSGESNIFQVLINDKVSPWSSDLLPERIFSFTTGDEAEWKNKFEGGERNDGDESLLTQLTTLEQATKGIPGRRLYFEEKTVSEVSRFRHIQEQQLPLITLCGLLLDLAQNKEGPQLKDILEQANISRFCGFSLRFRMNQGQTLEVEREKIRGLASLSKRALHIGSDYLLVFDLTEDSSNQARKLLRAALFGFELIGSANHPSDKEPPMSFCALRFFELLADMATVQISGVTLLQEIDLFLERSEFGELKGEGQASKTAPLHLLSWLSDGERSFIGRLCLLSLLGSTESLILLDEPEVHFNDAWKRQIVFLLDEALKGSNSHVLITSHSSITLTDVPREDIVVLERVGNYTSESFSPGIKTFAADPSEIMVHVFGAPYSTGREAVSKIEEALALIKNQTTNAQEQLHRLLDQIGPGYWSYKIRRELVSSEKE